MSKQKVPEVQQNELLDQIDLDEDKICWHGVQIKKQSSHNVPWGTETRIVLVQHQLTLVWQWNIVNARKINLNNDQNLLTKNIWVPADHNISAFRPVYFRWNCLIFKVMFMKLGNLHTTQFNGKELWTSADNFLHTHSNYIHVTAQKHEVWTARWTFIHDQPLINGLQLGGGLTY